MQSLSSFSMNSVLILSFGLLVFLNCWVKSEEFCRAFRENNDRISYTYDFDSHNGLDVFIDVIINGKHWRLQTNNKVEDLKFKDQKIESQPTLAFYSSGDYSLELTSCKNSWEYCSVLLINTNTWMVSIGTLSTGTTRTGDLKPENLKSSKTLKMKGIKGKPFAAFQTDYGNSDSNFKDRRVFVEYNPTTGQLDAKTYDLFATDGTEINAVDMTWDNSRMKFLKTTIEPFNLLSLISFYKQSDRWGYVLLFEKNLQIRWCWTHAEKALSNECKPGKLLIDCSSVPLPVTIPKTTTTIAPKTTATTTTTPKTTTTTITTPETTTTTITLSPTTTPPTTTLETSTSAMTTSLTTTSILTTSESLDETSLTEWIAIVIIVCIVIVILVIIGIIIFFMTKKSKSEADINTSQASNVSTESVVSTTEPAKVSPLRVSSSEVTSIKTNRSVVSKV